MIDIHHHCLPGIDDGPKEWKSAVEQCRMAFDQGISTIVATPHVLRGSWQNDAPGAIDALVEKLHSQLQGKPEILTGCEYYFAHDMIDMLQRKTILPLASSRYVLVEFAAHSLPPMIDRVFYQLQISGWTPIIAHPERNLVFQRRPELLQSLVERGGKTQVTAMSITGGFGARARRAALEWIARGMVHIVATDAHNTSTRPPLVREPRSIVETQFGEEMAAALFERNPLAIIRNETLSFDPEPFDPRPPTGLLEALRQFLGRS
ncbi:MAG TPA: CpsB/CapC family capsule biosynthesis tyrosine phosphatase [Thermoanaerobaculia bacterium]|nr:CpsB/CapC family capsule biosynthesis tyrosine phosphatase [Thermoanaerobaculia bacterium]